MNQLIENSPNKDFFELLQTYQNSKAAELAKAKLAENAESAGFMMLKSWLMLSKYVEAKELGSMKLNYSADYAGEIAEMGRLIDIYVSELKQYEAAKPLAVLTGGLLTEAAQHIDNATKNIGHPPVITADLWMSAAMLRDWALYMATYFEDRKDFQNEVQMRFVRCKITNCAMSQHMHLVGPDMIGTAKALEKIKLPERALHFYQAVIMDFNALLDELKGKTISVEEKIALWSLREANAAFIRLGKSTDIEQSKALIAEIDRLID